MTGKISSIGWSSSCKPVEIGLNRGSIAAAGTIVFISWNSTSGTVEELSTISNDGAILVMISVSANELLDESTPHHYPFERIADPNKEL